MHWYVFSEFPLEKDLGSLHRLLDQYAIAHRFTEEAGVQKFWLREDVDLHAIQHIIEQFEQGTLPDAAESSANPIGALSAGVVSTFVANLLRVPLTLAIIMLGFVGYLAIAWEIDSIVGFLHFAPFGHPDYQYQYWRLLGPAFLHFNAMHFIFNAVIIWFVGMRLEVFMGKAHYFLLFVVCAVAANIFQFVASNAISFGGLSGAAYGYVYGNFVLSKRWPVVILSLPPAIYVFFLFMLALGFLGIVDFFIIGRVANWAHLGGLVGGVVYALLYCLLKKRGDNGS